MSLTQDAQSKINRNEDNVAVRRQHGAVVEIATAPLVTFTVNEHHDWILS